MTGRFADALTAIAARAYPRARRTDARVVRDCAREAIAADGTRALARESASLVTGGLRARVRVASLELGRAPLALAHSGRRGRDLHRSRRPVSRVRH